MIPGVNRRQFLLLGAAAVFTGAATGVTGCSFANSPEPDPALARLAAAARRRADLVAPVSPATAGLLNSQSDALTGEISRLCGHTENGSVPESCDLAAVAAAGARTAETDPRQTGAPTTADHAGDPAVPPDAGKQQVAEFTAGILAAQAAEIIDALSVVPGESVAIIARQHAAIAVARGWSDPDGPALSAADTEHGAAPREVGPVSDQSDIDMVRRALSRQFSADYGLGVALAHADDTVRDRLARARDEHRITAGNLQAVLEADPSAPVDIPLPEAGYTFTGGPVPGTSQEAAEFAAELEANQAVLFQALAVDAVADSWREHCVLSASRAAVRTLAFSEITGHAPSRERYL